MSLSRRQFIPGIRGCAMCRCGAAEEQMPPGNNRNCPFLPLFESRRGQPLFLTLQRTHWSFTTGTRAEFSALMGVIWGQRSGYGTAMTSN